MESTKADDDRMILNAAINVVSAYLGHNTVAANDVPATIRNVYETVKTLWAFPPNTDLTPEQKLTPAVPIKKSVHPEYIVCLESGKKLKMLKRHLRHNYGMSPDEYRDKWGLPADYPMVAPAYAAKRSELAKELGLGRFPRAAA